MKEVKIYFIIVEFIFQKNYNYQIFSHSTNKSIKQITKYSIYYNIEL